MSEASDQQERPSGQSVAPPDDESALRAVVEGTAHGTGQAFFQALVRHLADAIGVRYAFVAEFTGDHRVRTVGYWYRDRLADDVEWDVRGTPCEDVVAGNLCHHPSGVWQRFTADEPLVRMRIESYLGVPLRDVGGRVLGHLAVFDERPMPTEPRRLSIFNVFAARAAAELQRLRDERQLADSERRFRDLYEEAPIAYIYEDLESRFVSANRAAMKLLGLGPGDVPGTLGKSLLAQNNEQTLSRIRDALEAMKASGQEFSCIELELHRKDDGRPVWVQWYSRPEPDGQHTRTMLIDITDRVRMEQEQARLRQQNLYLQEEIKSSHNFEEIVGRSGLLAQVLENVRRVAPTDATVLLTGETGTGKELIARAIHSASSRVGKALVKVNCAALPTGLVESELFGHERGAFSGAIARRVGRFEIAHGGTIFLDEIGELPPEVQAKLLRVLQEREFERVGGNAPIKADVRVIAATNRDLAAAVRAGTFREDLFYRLNVFPIHLPALRERDGDIPLLVQFLLGRFRTRLGKRIEGVTAETMRRLTRYAWPGNVRELENVLERAAILATTPMIEIGADVLPAAVVAAPPAPAPPPAASPASSPASALASSPESRRIPTLSVAEREHILSALRQTRWVIDGPNGAARILDMHPNTLRSRMKKLGITRPEAATHEPS